MTESQEAALRLAGRLLSYPNPGFLKNLPELRQEAAALEGDRETADFGKAALQFIQQMAAAPPADSGQRYVAIFDHTASASLYMSWHRYGNDRSQGRAMAALNGLYRTAGYEPVSGDMPDYLPVILEFLSIAPDWAREALLDGFGAEIAALLATLAELKAPHAPFLEKALAPLREQYPQRFLPRKGTDPTRRPMARPEPEPLEPLIPVNRQDK